MRDDLVIDSTLGVARAFTAFWPEVRVSPSLVSSSPLLSSKR